MKIKDPLYFFSICYLTLPIFIFAGGWLRPIFAVIFITVFLISIYLVLKSLTHRENNSLYYPKIILILLVLFIWTLLSGSGGIFGYQNADYAAHNGRLNDLINFSWPVVYANGQVLVYYIAYYLPNALLGKLIGYQLASQLMLLWLFLGVSMTMFWIFRILKIKPSWFITFLFIFFSGMDALGYMLTGQGFFLGRGVAGGKDGIEYWARGGEFLGYNSNTFLLYWSPQQTIGGWLISAITFFEIVRCKRVINVVFIWILSLLWSPFITVGLLPFVGYAFLKELKEKHKNIFNFQNIIGAGATGLLFALFYLAGATLKNPGNWIWNIVNITDFWPHLALFYLLEFGIYALIVVESWDKMSEEFRHFFLIAVGILVLLPVYSYGVYNDFMLRASIPSLFFIFLTIAVYFIHKKFSFRNIIIENTILKLLFIFLAIGSFTAIVEISRGIYNPHKRRPPMSPSDFGKYNYQFLGDKESFFFKYLAK